MRLRQSDETAVASRPSYRDGIALSVRECVPGMNEMTHGLYVKE